jgi:TPP-dependent pyruvate/acetoin dehydrogenase alpha subunit
MSLIPRDQLVPLFQSMLLMRRLEEAVCDIGPPEVVGTYHVYIGQEATGASVCSLLVPDDPIFSTHRNHGHMVARGLSPEEVLSELLVKATGASQGKGGTQHIMSKERRTVATSIVGGSTMLATGAALAAQTLGDDWIAVAFLGERSTNEGVVPEALNLASLWELPVLYVCENNNAVPYDSRHYNTALAQITDLASAYRVTARSVDATDPEATYAVAAELVEQVRTQRKPAFVEARTPALPGRSHGEHPTIEHIGRTDLRVAWAPPPDDPLAAWHRADPVLRMAGVILREDATTPDELLRLDSDITARIGAAVSAARAAPFPTGEDAFAHVLADGDLWPR